MHSQSPGDLTCAPDLIDEIISLITTNISKAIDKSEELAGMMGSTPYKTDIQNICTLLDDFDTDEAIDALKHLKDSLQDD